MQLFLIRGFGDVQVNLPLFGCWCCSNEIVQWPALTQRNSVHCADYNWITNSRGPGINRRQHWWHHNGPKKNVAIRRVVALLRELFPDIFQLKIKQSLSAVRRSFPCSAPSPDTARKSLDITRFSWSDYIRDDADIPTLFKGRRIF